MCLVDAGSLHASQKLRDSPCLHHPKRSIAWDNTRCNASAAAGRHDTGLTNCLRNKSQRTLEKWGRRGFTRQPENSKRAHFRGRRFKHHQNFTKRLQDREEKKKIVAGEGKKSEILASPPRTPTLRAPTLRTAGSHPSMAVRGLYQTWTQ